MDLDCFQKENRLSPALAQIKFYRQNLATKIKSSVKMKQFFVLQLFFSAGKLS